MANLIPRAEQDPVALSQPFDSVQTADPYAKSLRQAVALRMAAQLPLLVMGVGPVCKYIAQPSLAAVPNVQPWFVGVHSEEGILAPVLDLWCWSAAASPAQAGMPLTRISEAALQVALLCPEPPLVVSVLLDLPGPELREDFPAPLRPFLGKSLHTDHGAAFAFDPFAWFKQIASSIVRTP